MTDAATRALGRAKELSATITLALFVLPLGVVAHAAAFAALPMQLASAMLRELTMSRGTDVRALLRGLYALALKPSLAAACAAEIKDDGEIFREYSRSSSEKIEAFRKMSEIEREKFIAACAKLKEEEQIRERLREQLNATRDELKRERAANFAQGKFSKGKEETGSGGVYLTTALLGVMLLYFHDMDTVHTLDHEKASVEEKMNVLEKSIMSLHTKTKEIRDDIINHASQQKTIEKSSANLLKQTKVTYQNIAQKEIEIEDLSNEISRVRIDNLNCVQQNDLLKKKLEELIAELKEKENEVEKFEQDIK